MARKSNTTMILEYIEKEGKNLSGRKLSTGTTYYRDYTRIFKVVGKKDLDLIEIEFNVDIDTNDPEVRHLTREWAKAHKYGTCKSILRTRNLKKAKDLLAKVIK